MENVILNDEEDYRVLLKSIRDSVYVLNKEWRHILVNDAAESFTGIPKDKLLGSKLTELFPGVENTPFFKTFQRVMENREPDSVVHEYTFEDGRKGWYEVYVYPVPEGILCISRDITERKIAEKEREKLQQRLIQSQKMETVGRLAGGVAHDFNNMLGVILGRTELMLMDMTSDNPLYEDLMEIQKAAERSADLTRQLLAFARKQNISPEVLDLNETVESMLKMLKRLIGEDINLVWQPDTNLWHVKMDTAQIDQILANLCVNARDSISGVGNITIETKNMFFEQSYCDKHPEFIPGAYVMLSVSDDGCGMDKQTQEKIFEPFFTTKEAGKGTGLGLSTVYGIVKQNNGFVYVYSEPGEGSIFKIYIPRHEEKPAEQDSTDAMNTPQSQGETVLLVEDNPRILNMVKLMLENLGYSVLSSSKPIEALELAKEYTGKIDLLLTDIVMPQMAGKELGKRLGKICPEIKVLFMSGYTDNVIANHGVLDEDVHFIQKPFSISTLATHVKQALEK